MTLEWREGTLWVTWLPVDAMGRLASCAPQGRAEQELLAALLAGAKVYVPWGAMEYRQYRKIAPHGIYRRFVALERKLREMGVIAVRNGGGKSVGDQKGAAAGGTGVSARKADRQ